MKNLKKNKTKKKQQQNYIIVNQNAIKTHSRYRNVKMLNKNIELFTPKFLAFFCLNSYALSSTIAKERKYKKPINTM